MVAANALYGATVSLLMKVLEPAGVAVRFVDVCDLDALRAAVAEAKPGCILMETISNPLLRVAQLDRIAEIARAAGAALVVDNTFATPLIVRPLELGAHFSVHSLTKYLAGHGDVLGGVGGDRARALRRPARALAHRRSGAGAVRKLPDHARHQDLSAAHGAAVRQCLPRGAVAGGASAQWSACISRATRRIPTPPTIRRLFPPEPLRRHGELRDEAAPAARKSSASWTRSR